MPNSRPPSEAPQPLDGFIRLSVELTGFNEFELTATGMVEAYYRTAVDRVSKQVVEDLCQRFHGLGIGSAGEARSAPALTNQERLLLSGVACAVAEMWYLGFWPGLSRDAYAALLARVGGPCDAEPSMQEMSSNAVCDVGPTDSVIAPNEVFAVSAEAYVQGLVWKCFDGHPMGARPPGFGSWSLPPRDLVKQGAS